MRLLQVLPLVYATAHALKGTPPPFLPRYDDQYIVSRLPERGPIAPLAELKTVSTVVELRRENASSISSIYVQAIRAQAAGRRPEWSRVTV